MSRNGYYIVLDFDGTVVKHRYPAVGEDIGAVPVLRKLVQNGYYLILNTMRSRNSEGKDTLPIGAGQHHGYLCDIVPEGPHAPSSRKNFL